MFTTLINILNCRTDSRKVDNSSNTAPSLLQNLTKKVSSSINVFYSDTKGCINKAFNNICTIFPFDNFLKAYKLHKYNKAAKSILRTTYCKYDILPNYTDGVEKFDLSEVKKDIQYLLNPVSNDFDKIQAYIDKNNKLHTMVESNIKIKNKIKLYQDMPKCIQKKYKSEIECLKSDDKKTQKVIIPYIKNRKSIDKRADEDFIYIEGKKKDFLAIYKSLKRDLNKYYTKPYQNLHARLKELNQVLDNDNTLSNDQIQEICREQQEIKLSILKNLSGALLTKINFFYTEIKDYSESITNEAIQEIKQIEKKMKKEFDLLNKELGTDMKYL